MTRDEFESKYYSELLFDDPIDVFGIKLYPIKMVNYPIFDSFISILTIKKDRIPDAKIISMSYLDYLFTLINEELNNDGPHPIKISLLTILSLCTNFIYKDIAIGKDKNNRTYIRFNDNVLYSREFNNVKDIILFQNINSYTGIELNPQLEEDLIEAERLRHKYDKECSIEKKMISAMIGTSISINDLKNMSIRKFNFLLDMIDRKLMFTILKTASYSGFVEFKNEIPHYLTEQLDVGLSNKVTSYSELKNKLGNVSKFN